jgi:hypothetical protein
VLRGDSYPPAVDANVAETSPAITLSIVIESPTYELWVHYKVGKEHHMHCLASWRTTLPSSVELLFIVGGKQPRRAGFVPIAELIVVDQSSTFPRSTLSSFPPSPYMVI